METELRTDPLETDRLILRMWNKNDINSYAEICADAETMKYIGGKPLDRIETWRSVAWFIGHWHLKSYGLWAVEEKESKTLLGRIGFINPEGWPGFELGWMIRRDAWGKGYATEGAKKCLEYAFTELNKDRVISLVHSENIASQRVAERIGEELEGETELMETRVNVYGIHKDKWEAI